eukprot:m.663666 g.663666  ORF g.663666 m.663666 type:complete len:66 (-) comp22744_c0_seq6:237-434(-)
MESPFKLLHLILSVRCPQQLGSASTRGGNIKACEPQQTQRQALPYRLPAHTPTQEVNVNLSIPAL